MNILVMIDMPVLNVCYVIEQLENTTGNPYHWKIVWYIAIPENVGG